MVGRDVVIGVGAVMGSSKSEVRGKVVKLFYMIYQMGGYWQWWRQKGKLEQIVRN